MNSVYNELALYAHADCWSAIVGVRERYSFLKIKNHSATVTSNPNPDLISVIAQMQSGNAQAATVFVETHYEWLHLIVKAQYPEMDGVTDVVHDSLLLIIEKINSQEINELSKIRSFMRTTAINVAHQHHRKHNQFVFDAEFGTIESSLQTAAEALDWENKLAIAKQVLQELPKQRDRAVLQAYYLDHLSKAQICDQLGCSAPLFDSILHRAKNRLKQKLQDRENKWALGGKTWLSLLISAWAVMQVNQVMI